MEGLNKLVNKITAIAKQANANPHEAIHDMLQAYRSSSHPATKKTPYELLMNREVRTKLDHFPRTTHLNDQEVRANDRSYKEKCKEYHDKRHNTKEHTLRIGDAVVVKRENKCKAQRPYEPYIYIITYIKGSEIQAKRIKDERTICRDASKFKPLRHVKVQQEKPDIPLAKASSVPNTVEEPKETTETVTKPTQAETAQSTNNHAPPPRQSERLKELQEQET